MMKQRVTGVQTCALPIYKRGAGRISESIYHPKTLVINGLLSEESASLLRDFFAKKR
jgi:hypothetical protein